jgi:alpha-glucosidase
VKRLKLQVTFETDTRLHVKLSDADNERFEVPEALFRRPEANSNVDKESAAYKFMLADGEQFAFKVVRKSDGEVIFDSSSPGGGSFIKPLIYEEQYLEISSRLPENANIFGYFTHKLLLFIYGVIN